MQSAERIQQKLAATAGTYRLLRQLTAGSVLVAMAGVGALGYVSAQTIPGHAATTTASDSSALASTGSTSSGLSAGSVSSSTSGSAVAVTGGS
ncbi:MAG TPA: hypothetical protein VGV88_12065 [Candidatus Dormibacteraeota bacterium]|nr:hypothetical protein [Candidatus Dormibacteraeota bacterium]